MERALTRLDDGESLALLYVDVDRFKAINDTMGHSAGDRVLQAVGSRLKEAIGVEDIASRLSGDEFAVCLRAVAAGQNVADLSRDIASKVCAPLSVDGHNVSIGISIGIALSRDPGDTAEDLLQRADIALYRSKENGRGQLTVFRPEMLQALQDRRAMELDLQTALKRKQFELLYQPLIDIENEQTIGYEALVRWNHPTRGIILPNEFIAVAETTGTIVQLSPAQMGSPNLLPTIIHGLAAAGVEAHRLEMEITENVILSQDHANIDLLNKIRSLGVRFALDDFGTGYSSLNYLRSFPFDKIKIDRCFVEEIVSRKDCQAIVRAVADLASSLGMVTTAEGIECEQQLAQVKRAGCKQVQGHLFSKAIPAHEIEGRIVRPPSKYPSLDHIIRPSNAEDSLQERKIG